MIGRACVGPQRLGHRTIVSSRPNAGRYTCCPAPQLHELIAYLSDYFAPQTLLPQTRQANPNERNFRQAEEQESLTLITARENTAFASVGCGMRLAVEVLESGTT